MVGSASSLEQRAQQAAGVWFESLVPNQHTGDGRDNPRVLGAENPNPLEGLLGRHKRPRNRPVTPLGRRIRGQPVAEPRPVHLGRGPCPMAPPSSDRPAALLGCLQHGNLGLTQSSASTTRAETVIPDCSVFSQSTSSMGRPSSPGDSTSRNTTARSRSDSSLALSRA